MPLYEFKTADGEPVELWMTISQLAERTDEQGRFMCGDGTTLQRVFTSGGAQTEWAKPIHSTAMAVHPKDRLAAMRKSVERGVPTAFDREGRPVLMSRGHRRRFMRTFHYQDLDGGYGDA